MPAAERWWEQDPVDQPAAGGGDRWWEADPEVNDTGPAPPALAGRAGELRVSRPRAGGWREFFGAATGKTSWDNVRAALWGTEEQQQDRAEARSAGVGLDPTAGELIDAGATAASMLGGEAAVIGALGKALPAAGRFSKVYPEVAGAVADAAPELLRGDISGAVGQAVRGAALGAAVRGVRGAAAAMRGAPAPAPAPAPTVTLPASPAEALEEARALLRAGRHEEARALAEAARDAARKAPHVPPPTPAPVQPAPVELETRAQGLPAPPAPRAARAAAAPGPPKADPGKTAAAAHGEVMAFAKQAAQQNPKMGAKIHILFDANGKPVGVLTSDEAGAVTRTAERAKRKGEKPDQTTRWVKNLWGKPADVFVDE